jgi:hypothetical protein
MEVNKLEVLAGLDEEYSKLWDLFQTQGPLKIVRKIQTSKTFHSGLKALLRYQQSTYASRFMFYDKKSKLDELKRLRKTLDWLVISYPVKKG